MIKRFLVMLCICSICLTACSNNDEKETEVINNSEKETENIATEEVFISKNYYDFLYDPNVLFIKDGYSYLTGEDLYEAEKGKVIVYQGFIDFLNKQENDPKILYAAELGYKNTSVHNIYYDFLKKHNIISEFSYKTDEDINQMLIDKYIIQEKSKTYCYRTVCTINIYATKEQLISLHNTSIENDMEIFIRAIQWPYYTIAKEDVDYYKGNLMPVEYNYEIDEKKEFVRAELTKEEVINLLNKNVEVQWDRNIVLENYKWKQEY